MASSTYSIPQTEAADRSARCWELAIKIFNTTLTNDPKKIIYISAPSPGYNTATYNDVVDTAKKCIQSPAGEKRDICKAMESTLLTLNQYAECIDVLVQHQPHVTALVWGAFRGLLQVALTEINVSKTIAQCINKITGEIGRWDQYLRLFLDSDRLQTAVAQLFAQIVNYIVRATAFYSTPLSKRYVKAGLSTTPAKLRDIWTEIEDLSLKLEREANLASEESHKRNLDKCCKSKAALLNEIAQQERYRGDSLTSMKAIEAAQSLVHQKFTELKSSIDGKNEDDTVRRRATELNDDKRRIVTWLQRSRNYNPGIPPWEPGTADWIVRHPVYLDWEERHNEGCLWINGMPGCGKSIMASFLVHRSPTPVKIAHFLQAAVEESSTRTVAVAASILLQLLQDPVISSDLKLVSSLTKLTLPLLESFSTFVECHFEQIWEVFEKVYVDLPPFTLVVDALDECCAAEDASKLVHKLKQMSNVPQARVIVLSRLHHSLKMLLKDSKMIQMDETTVTEDILLFIQNEVKRTPKIRIPVESILQKARTHAKGMFLWAKLMLQYLQQAPTPRMQRSRLEKFPAGLIPIYEKLLGESGEKFEPEQLALRKRIFILLVAATSPLTVEDLVVALVLDAPNKHPGEDDFLIDPTEQIATLCWPFTKIVDSNVQFVHYSMQEFLLLTNISDSTTHIHFTRKESNAYMALKCLFRLINTDARSIRVLKALLQLRLGDSAVLVGLESLPRHWHFYLYAANHWHLHLVQSDNNFNLLQHVEMFLTGLEFISWVEEFDNGKRDMGAIVDVQASLSAWHMSLKEGQRECVSMRKFFEKPFNDFFELESVRNNMPEIAYMAMQRLGVYHNLNGTQSRGRTLKEIRKLVLEGFAITLGTRHPLTLRCTVDWCIEQIVDDDRELLAGEALLLETMAVQRELFGGDAYDSYYTQQYAGLAMYYRGRFVSALEHLRNSYEGLGRILGPNHKYFQQSRIYYARALVGTSQYKEASQIYEEVWNLWSHLHGAQHPLSTMAQCNLGVTYRSLRKFNLAEKHLVNCLSERQRMFGSSVATFDSTIQLALLYRDMGRTEEAYAYLDLAEGMDLEKLGFERYCHAYHLRGLLAWESGDQKMAKKYLEFLLSKGKEHPTSRALMWVRLTLADLLRQQGHENKASSLFVNIVKSLNGCNQKLRGIDLKAQLHDADNSVRIALEQGAQVAEEQLRSKGLVWLFPEAFWIIFGGPAAEVF